MNLADSEPGNAEAINLKKFIEDTEKKMNEITIMAESKK